MQRLYLQLFYIYLFKLGTVGRNFAIPYVKVEARPYENSSWRQ